LRDEFRNWRCRLFRHETKHTFLGRDVIEHGKPPKSYVLAEGEQQDDIKVVTIDGNSQTVRVKNQGVYVILDFKTHGLRFGADPMAANSGPVQ